MEKDSDNNFGAIVSEIIDSLNQAVVAALPETGIAEDKIIELSIEMRHMVADSMLDYLEEHFLEEVETEQSEHDLYIDHLHSIWGRGLSWMWQYYEKCSDICEGYGWCINQDTVISDRCNVFEALRAIHGRAMLVYAEIICLLENGYPDGASARFRSLYELWIVAEFIDNDIDDVARAYIESEKSKSENEASHYKWAEQICALFKERKEKGDYNQFTFIESKRYICFARR